MPAQPPSLAIFLSPCTNMGGGAGQYLTNQWYPGVPCYKRQGTCQLKSPRAMSPLATANVCETVLLGFREIRGEPRPQGPTVLPA